MNLKLQELCVVNLEKSGRPREINEKITGALEKIFQNERKITTREIAARLDVGNVNTVKSI